MSHDLHVWSTEPAALPAMLPDRDAWKAQDESWVRAGGEWRLTVAPSLSAAEDVPDELGALLPGLAYFTALTLEPIHAPANAKAILRKTATRIAQAAHGVLFDPQEDTVKLPSGVKRYIPASPSASIDLLVMSWWFDEQPFRSTQDYDTLVSVLERWLPEALPRRYGLYEPPQFRYEETGREHLVNFLATERGVVWYPQRPVANVALAITPTWGATKRGFRSNRLELSVERLVLKQPGWASALRELWRRLSLFLRPFYGDVRTLRGFKRHGASYYSDAAADRHPVCAWWWAGLPPTSGHAFVLGADYLKHWPDVARAATMEEGLAFITTSQWTDDGDAYGAGCGPPPRELMDPAPMRKGDRIVGHDEHRPYPSTWPFGATHDPTRW